MTAAYILMQLTATDPRKIMKSIRAVTGVKQAHLLVGPTDCIAYVEVESQQQAMDTLRAIRDIKGVLRTDMRSAAEL